MEFGEEAVEMVTRSSPELCPTTVKTHIRQMDPVARRTGPAELHVLLRKPKNSVWGKKGEG